MPPSPEGKAKFVCSLTSYFFLSIILILKVQIPITTCPVIRPSPLGNAEIIRRQWRMQDDWSAEGEAVGWHGVSRDG